MVEPALLQSWTGGVGSNCAVRRGKYPAYRKPFDMIFERAKNRKMVEPKGFEPSTSSMPSRRAPNCATAPPEPKAALVFIASGCGKRQTQRDTELARRYRNRGKK